MDQQKQIRVVLWVILGLNAATAVAKLVYGVATDTVTIQADGVHSLLDGSSNVLALVAIRLAHAPPDRDHPYGHGRFETVGALAIGLMILAGGGAIGWEAWRSVAEGVVPRAGPGGVAMIASVAALNFGISWYEDRAGRRLGSSLLRADAAHTRSDFYSSLVALGATLAIWAGLPRVDLPAAAVVVVMIVRTGLAVLRRELGVLTDTAAVDPDEVLRVVLATPGVRGSHKVRSRGGAAGAFVDLHVQVDPELPIREAHALAGAVKARIRAAIPGVEDVLIHIEPDDMERGEGGSAGRDGDDGPGVIDGPGR